MRHTDLKKASRSPHLSFPDTVRLRQEHFGGILFHTRTGTTMEVDREAYRLVSLIQSRGVVDINNLDRVWFERYNHHLNHPQALKIVDKLVALNMLIVMPSGLLHRNLEEADVSEKDGLEEWPSGSVLSAPETVHWAVTFRCDLACPDCYVQRHSHTTAAELDTEQSLALIDRLAEAGIFQLAIGGGEPFLRSDLIQLLVRAKAGNMVTHVTTGRHLDIGTLKEIGKYITSLQVGIKQDALIQHPSAEREKLSELIVRTREQGIDVGANLILSRSTIHDFESIIEELSRAGFKRITLLRYKPAGDRNRWVQEKPASDELLSLEEKLGITVDTYSHIQFRVDCGLAFLERHLPPEQAGYHGIRGCSAAERILSIAPDGSVYPCSQLVGPKFRAGHLPTDEFQDIWRNSEILRRYRKFRTHKGFKKSQCGQCMAKSQCGGCRVFAPDALGADPGCPAPILLPAKSGKHPVDERYAMVVSVNS